MSLLFGFRNVHRVLGRTKPEAAGKTRVKSAKRTSQSLEIGVAGEPTKTLWKMESQRREQHDGKGDRPTVRGPIRVLNEGVKKV